MVRILGTALAVSAALCMAASPAAAQFTKDELKCETGTGRSLGKQVSAHAKCTERCIKSARKTSGPYLPCFDDTTLACITDPVRGPAARAAAAIAKACAKDCPECYTAQGTLCTNGQPLVATTQSLVDTQGSIVYCLEAAGATPTKDQAKCEDGNVKALVKYVAAINRCYQRCATNAQKGTIPSTACAPALNAGPPPPTDAATATCLTTAKTKAAAAIDKVCTATTKPACYGPVDGNGWATLVEGLVFGQTDDIVCGSPAGAFLD